MKHINLMFFALFLIIPVFPALSGLTNNSERERLDFVEKIIYQIDTKKEKNIASRPGEDTRFKGLQITRIKEKI